MAAARAQLREALGSLPFLAADADGARPGGDASRGRLDAGPAVQGQGSAGAAGSDVGPTGLQGALASCLDAPRSMAAIGMSATAVASAMLVALVRRRHP